MGEEPNTTVLVTPSALNFFCVYTKRFINNVDIN